MSHCFKTLIQCHKQSYQVASAQHGVIHLSCYELVRIRLIIIIFTVKSNVGLEV